MENPLKNIAINLRAHGPAAVIIAWVGGVTVLGLYGDGDLAIRAMNILAVAGGIILVTLAART